MTRGTTWEGVEYLVQLRIALTGHVSFADVDNLGYFPLILGLFYPVKDYLK